MRIACHILVSLALLLSAIETGSAKENPKKKEPQVLKCSTIAKKLRRRKKASQLKNKVFRCDGRVLKIYKAEEDFPQVLERHRPWLRRSQRPYLVEVKLQGRRFRRVKAYLLSTEREVTEVLIKGANVEFSGQIFLKPFRKAGRWHLVFLNQQVTYKL